MMFLLLISKYPWGKRERHVIKSEPTFEAWNHERNVVERVMMDGVV